MRNYVLYTVGVNRYIVPYLYINKLKIAHKTLMYKIFLNEGVESKNMKAAKHYLYDKMGYEEKQAMNCIGQIKTDIPNSRLGKCKFMLAMVRMFCNGEFKDGSIIMNVNKCLKYAASNAHINEYNQDLNGLSSEEFIKRFSGVSQQDLEQDKIDVNSQQYDKAASQYKIVQISSFEAAEEYGEYVEWCITHYEDMFESYTSNGHGVFYFCLRNGFENEPREEGENCPLDSYGLSMIAVSINSDGSCNTITCRWNHDNGGNDNVMTPKQLSQVINMNFYEVFKPLTPQQIQQIKQAKIYDIQNEIERWYYSNEEPSKFCNEMCYDSEEGDVDKRNVYEYVSDKGSVILYDDCEFVIEDIFDNVGDRKGDLINVRQNKKWNYLSINGEYISNVWYDTTINVFDCGFALVMNNKKWNIINKGGQLLLKEWCDNITDSTFKTLKGSGVAEIINNGQLMFVSTTNGQNIFNKEIADRRPFLSYYSYSSDEDEMKCYQLIKFKGDNFYQFYDIRNGKLLAPYKIATVNGRYGIYPYIQLLNDENYYVLVENGDLFIKKENMKQPQLVQKNPFSQQASQQAVNEQKKRTIFITEKQANFLKEVRYIDTRNEKYKGKVYKNDPNDVYNQEPIKNGEKIRVYHGCSLETAVDWCVNGTSGREIHPRTYSYESGMNPLGVFVTVDFENAKKFGQDYECLCIIEFTADTNDLESPVWNGNDSYFSQGSNPQPFRNKEERDKQKEKYDNDVRNIKDDEYWDFKSKSMKKISYDYLRNSDKPAMAQSIFNNTEHQALFMGDLNPNQIKRIWINQKDVESGYISTTKKYIPLSVKEFLKLYRNHEFYVQGSYNKKRKIEKNKYYLPNDDFKGWDDYFDRMAKFDKWDISDEQRKENISYINQYDNYKKTVCQFMFPKQIIQAFGKDFFDDNFNRFGQ